MEEEGVFEVEEILDHKILNKRDLYYIHWKGYDQPEDNTWEPLSNLHDCIDLVIDYYNRSGKKIPSKILSIQNSKNIMFSSSIEYENPEFSNSSIQVKPEISNHIEGADSDQKYLPQTEEIYSEQSDSYRIKKDENKIDSESDFNESNSSIIDLIHESNFKDDKKSAILNKKLSFWDKYGYLFKAKGVDSISKSGGNCRNIQEVELDVARICGKRKLDNELEYLVEWEEIVDKYTWIKEKDLSCDKVVRKFERKEAKNPPKQPFSFFQHKFDKELPFYSKEKVEIANKNLKKLKKELFT